ncbi:hypothetical protein [Cellulosimicrobium sp. Marseille-Q4280]|uniref:hypothetical protein n=1 Tax=Cellulosimicrobium sp. Marseille-Q4280 TaxID=2937992 RepID=UPI00203BA64D|nr:hypothetical protein [Cellulosimicrobium sp. Marseille-Q4280]
MTRNARRKAAVRALAASRGTTYTAALREHEHHPAVVHLALHPGASTSDLVAATGMSLLDLRRTGRAAGFGQLADGTWWLSEQDEGISAAVAAHQATAPGPLDVLLGHTGDLKAVHLTGGRTWAVTGIAGVGKTTLVRRVIDAALEQGRTVYRICGDTEVGGLAGELCTWSTLTHRFPAEMADLLERAFADATGPLVVVDDIASVLHALDERERAQVASGARRTDTWRARAALARVVDTYDSSGRTVVLAGVVDLERDDPRLHPWLGWASRTIDARFGQPWHERVGVLHDGSVRTRFALQPLQMQVRALAAGERVQFTDSGRWWLVRAVSSSGRYVALSSPHNLTGDDFYTVIDRARAIRAADDRVLGAGWRTDEDFTTNLRRIESGDLRLSVRNRAGADIAAVRDPDPARKPSPPARLAAPAGLQRTVVPIATTDAGTATLGGHQTSHVLVTGPNRYAAAQDLIDRLQDAGWHGEASLDPESGSEAALATASTHDETQIVVADALAELDRRYALLRQHDVTGHADLPAPVRVPDRFLMIDVDHAAAVPALEVSLNRIARTGRAVGVHLVAIAERTGGDMSWRTDVSQLQTDEGVTFWREGLGSWATVTGPPPAADPDAVPGDHEAGVVLAANAGGQPARFDLTRGLLTGGTYNRPASVMRLLADQAAAAGRTVHLVTARADEPLSRTFRGATLHTPDELPDLLEQASRSDLGVLVVADVPVADTWHGLNGDVEALTAIASAATAGGTWLVDDTGIHGSQHAARGWAGALGFRYGAIRSLYGRQATRKRLLPVDGAGLARTAPDGPLELVRAYC